ncbi:MAG: DNA helicase RecQ [Planctomycetota bacterium]|jgi:ATP-dependent DNA helicase RecQ
MTDAAANAEGRSGIMAALSNVFGFHAFRPNQESIIRAVMDRQDVFAVMPTGGGKSLCYQLPAHLLSGTCVVISPLISLMKDQVDAAKANGLRAEFLNSSLEPPEQAHVLRRLTDAELDLLYVAPERFAMDGFLATLKTVPLCLFAVDEAHCISEWGHDFRPDYLSLSRIVADFDGVPLAAFTATATERVQRDVVERLGLRTPFTVRASFNRPNLFYQVLPKDNVRRQLLAFLRDRPGQSGIVYRTTRSSVEQTADRLREAGVEALPYHAGLEPEVRKRHQEAFNRDEVDVIVATIAFGMGIDKSNVRFVVHADLPKNIESYYQETGRGGRDGEPAHCLLLFGRGDIPKIRYFIDQIPDETERTVAAKKLNQMASYATVNACRRRRLLGYFGESLEADGCGGCDVCAGQVEQVDATTDARIAMSAVARTGQRFGTVHVVDVITGADTEKVRDFRHDGLKTYGAGEDRPKRYWRMIIDNLIGQDCLRQTTGRFPVLHLTDKGLEMLTGGGTFHVLRQKEAPPPKAKRAKGEVVEYDPVLFERLRALRLEFARKRGVPPYIVFSDRTLHEMAHYRPATDDQMREITGVGDRKLAQYGEAFLAEIRAYVESENAEAGEDDATP